MCRDFSAILLKSDPSLAPFTQYVAALSQGISEIHVSDFNQIDFSCKKNNNLFGVKKV